MPINTISQMNQTLKNFDANEWKNDVSFKRDIENVSLDKEAGVSQPSGTQSFKDFLMGSLTEVNDLQAEANKAMEMLASGKSQNLHETMLAVERAEIAFKTMNQIRSKVISAYNEIMKMQV